MRPFKGFLCSMLFGLVLLIGLSACDRPEENSSIREVLGKRNYPMELWLCNYEDYDLYVAPQGNYQVPGGQNDFTKGWIFVPKKAADKGYSCVETFSYFYPYPEGVSPTSPGALTSIYGIAFQTAPAAFVRTDGGVYTPSGYASYDQFADFTEAGVCVPEVALGSTFTPEAKNPFTIEYLVSPRLSSKDQACPQGARMMPGLNLQFQFDSSFSKPFGSGLLGDDGEGERYRFNFFGGSTSVPPPKVETNQYGYAVNSPVPFEVQKTVREDIIPRAPIEGGDLERNLQKWRGQLNPKQQLILETIIALGKAFKETAIQLVEEAATINARLKSITAGAAQAVRDFSVCLAKVGVAGDYADWYEITSGKDFCNGSELTFSGRVATAAGLAMGSGKFWRAIAGTIGVVTVKGEKVARLAADILEDGRRKLPDLKDSEVKEVLRDLNPSLGCTLLSATGRTHKNPFDILFGVSVAYAEPGEEECLRQIFNEIVDNAGKSWSLSGYKHVLRGELRELNGAITIAGGLHTRKGLTEFIERNRLKGKNYTIAEVSSFQERNLDPSKVLVRRLSNGVTQVQFPREAFFNSTAASISLPIPGGGRIRHVKTLWPDSFNGADIAEAAKQALKNAGPNPGREISGEFRGIPFTIYQENGKITSCFPKFVN